MNYDLDILEMIETLHGSQSTSIPPYQLLFPLLLLIPTLFAIINFTIHLLTEHYK